MSRTSTKTPSATWKKKDVHRTRKSGGIFKAGKNSGARKICKKLLRRYWTTLGSLFDRTQSAAIAITSPPKDRSLIKDQHQDQDLDQAISNSKLTTMRPITKTSSTSTLIDVNDTSYDKDANEALYNTKILEQSHLYIEGADVDVDVDADTDYTDDTTTTLSLPAAPSASLHESICSHPILTTSATNAIRTKSIHTFQRKHVVGKNVPVIYVHQRETAHASSEQYGGKGATLVSDAATTCHIFALRSTGAGSGSDGKVLASLCHLDSTENESCIRDMVQEHVDYHFNLDDDSANNEKLKMEVHVVGGYNDSNGTSTDTTDFLFHLLRQIALETQFFMKVQLKTCIVSGLNDTVVHKEAKGLYTPLLNDKDDAHAHAHLNPKSSPIVRGLALDTNTGNVSLLQTVDPELLGPQRHLRRVRLWSSSPCAKALLLIHHYRKEEITIKAFAFQEFEGLEMLMNLTDDVMLEYSSTSPDCEGPDFCNQLRETCQFLLDYSVDDVFGVEMNTLVYKV